MNDVDLRRAEEPTGPLDDYIVPDPYFAWQKREGVRVIEDFAFEDLGKVELTPWQRKGGSGAIINIPNDELYNDSHLVEIKPGGQSEPEHHMYEEFVYVVSGRGATSVWHDDGPKQTFEWHAGSLFGIPLNAWYQHFNASGNEPARYLGMTNAPPVMRLFKDDAFIFDNPFRFASRFSGDENYFSGTGKLYKHWVWEANFIPNPADMPLYDNGTRGAAGISVGMEIVGNSIKSHISEFPVGTYKKAHHHGAGAHLIILGGQGYSLLWNPGEEPRKADWQAGAMVIVPNGGCLHQHFNTGNSRARYLALRPGDHGLHSIKPRGGFRPTALSINEGGWQIEYEDEDRATHELFEAEVAKNGAPCRMKAFIPWCTGEVGPTSERDA